MTSLLDEMTDENNETAERSLVFKLRQSISFLCLSAGTMKAKEDSKM